MENQIIEKADFTIDELEPNYYECTFDKCNFSGQSIGRVIFERCTFKECNLSLVKASNTSWLDVLFTDCKMTGINFTLSNRFGLSVEFRNCLLSYALFTEMKLKGTRFTRCDLQMPTSWRRNSPKPSSPSATSATPPSTTPTWKKPISAPPATTP